MKKHFSKILVLALCLVLALTLLPSAASAAEDYTLYFRNESGIWGLYQGNTGSTAYSATTTYSVDTTGGTPTLTLKVGFDFTTSAPTALYMASDTALVVADGATATITSTYSGSGSSYGISAADALEISGSGTLNATGGNPTDSGDSCGIYAVGALTFSGSGMVTATGGTAGGNSIGIFAETGALTISGGKTAAAGNTSALNKAPTALPVKYQYKTNASTTDPVTWTKSTASAYSYSAGHKYVAIQSLIDNRTLYYRTDGKMYDAASGGNLINDVTGWSGSGTTLTLSGIDFTTNAATALEVPDGVTIVLAGTNTLVSTNNITDSHGIFTDGSLTIKGGGTLNATGGTTTSASYGICADGVLSISGGTINAKSGGTSSDGSSAIYADALSISGGTVTATGGATTGIGSSYGICADALSVSGGTVNATGDDTSGSGQSFGIYAADALSISGGTVNTTGGDTSGSGASYGIVAYNDINISGGTVTAMGGDTTGTGKSYGFFTYDTITLSNGVTVKGAAAANGTPEAVTWDDSAYTYIIGADIAVLVKFTSPAPPSGGGSTPAPGHSFADGVNTHTRGAIKNLVHTTQKDFSLFLSVKVDGVTLTRGTHYEAASGSTVVTLYADYLNTLSVGKHTLSVLFSEDITVAAEFEILGTWSNPFTDVKASDWFYGDVEYIYNRGLMVGTSTTMFSPNIPLTRGMFATILWRESGELRVENGELGFGDVLEGAYYYDAVMWAADKGIVEGYGDGRFGPEAEITREELVTMLYRYVQLKGGGFEGPWMFLVDYADRDDISDWAYEAVCWCTVNEIVHGRPGKLFDPQGTATRAEAAAMLHRFLAE